MRLCKFDRLKRVRSMAATDRLNWPNKKYADHPYTIGMRVEYMFEDHQGKWYPGKVTAFPDAGGIQILFDDNEELWCSKFSTCKSGKVIGVRPEKHDARACQHCDWFKNSNMNFELCVNPAASMRMEHIEPRTVLEEDGRWRHCHLYKPNPDCIPLKTLSKLHTNGERCILLWFGKEEYEGLNFDYSMDRNGNLFDDDHDYIVSRRMR